MLTLYFGDIFSAGTTLLIAAVIALIAISVKDRNSISKWGRRIALFILLGTAVSGFCAIRDAYAAPGAVFAMDGVQSTICSIAGGAEFLTAIVSVFLKNQVYKRRCFYILSVLFTVQVLTIEGSRLFLR